MLERSTISGEHPHSPPTHTFPCTGSGNSACPLGSDCDDCGERKEAALPGEFQCTDVCYSSRDGMCDDGGAGATFTSCNFGSDCADCGARLGGTGCENGKIRLCDTSCPFAGDGRCDDGGRGAEFESCSFGTDCEDCGRRHDVCPTAALAVPPPAAPNLALPKACWGGTPLNCIFGRCDARNAVLDCWRCDCAVCDFCPARAALPPQHRTHLSPPPPPPPSPMWQFSCAGLQGRQKVRTSCSSLTAVQCESSYIYALAVDELETVLTVCRLVNGGCQGTQISSYDAQSCVSLQLAPVPPALPWPPASPAPPPASPPCLPLSAKCGGNGWSGLTNCCNSKNNAVSCFARSKWYSQCRHACDIDDWECHGDSDHTVPSERVIAPQSAHPPPSEPPSLPATSAMPIAPISGSVASAVGTLQLQTEQALAHSTVQGSIHHGQDKDTGQAGRQSTVHGAVTFGPNPDGTLKDASVHSMLDAVYPIRGLTIGVIAAALLLVMGGICGAIVVACWPVGAWRHSGYKYSRDVTIRDDLELSVTSDGACPSTLVI